MNRPKSDMNDTASNSRNCAEQADTQEEKYDSDDDEVEQFVDGRSLEFGLARVPHQLGVTPGEHDDAVAPRRVPKDGASQQHLVVVQRVLATLPVQRTLERRQVVVGGLAHDVAVEFG